MARTNHQLNLGPMGVQKSEREVVVVRDVDKGGHAAASEIFDAVMGELEKPRPDGKKPLLENKDVAYLCDVSESLVHKWREKTQRQCPSFAQMLLLPPCFHLELHRVMNRRYGFGRAALARLLEAASDLVVVAE